MLFCVTASLITVEEDDEEEEEEGSGNTLIVFRTFLMLLNNSMSSNMSDVFTLCLFASNVSKQWTCPVLFNGIGLAEDFVK